MPYNVNIEVAGHQSMVPTNTERSATPWHPEEIKFAQSLQHRGKQSDVFVPGRQRGWLIHPSTRRKAASPVSYRRPPGTIEEFHHAFAFLAHFRQQNGALCGRGV